MFWTVGGFCLNITDGHSLVVAQFHRQSRHAQYKSAPSTPSSCTPISSACAGAWILPRGCPISATWASCGWCDRECAVFCGGDFARGERRADRSPLTISIVAQPAIFGLIVHSLRIAALAYQTKYWRGVRPFLPWKLLDWRCFGSDPHLPVTTNPRRTSGSSFFCFCHRVRCSISTLRSRALSPH